MDVKQQFPYLSRFLDPLQLKSNNHLQSPDDFRQQWQQTKAAAFEARSTLDIASEDGSVSELQYETNQELCQRLIKQYKNTKLQSVDEVVVDSVVCD